MYCYVYRGGRERDRETEREVSSTGISLVSHGRPRGPLAEPPRISVPWSPYVCGVISRCPWLNNTQYRSPRNDISNIHHSTGFYHVFVDVCCVLQWVVAQEQPCLVSNQSHCEWLNCLKSWVIHGETWNSWAQPSSIDSQVSVAHSLATSSTTSALVSCASVKAGTRLTQQKMGRKNQGHPKHLWENVIPPNPGMYFGGGLLLHLQDPWNFLEPQLYRWHHIDVWIFSWWALALTTGSLQKLI